MKKICFITTIPLTLEAFVMPLISYLHDNTNWEITVICTHDENFKNKLPNFVEYCPVDMKRGISITGIKSIIEMYKIFKEKKFDLIQYSTPNAALYASIAGFLAKIPNRLYCQWGMVFVAFEGIKRKIFKLEEQLVCSLSTWIEPDSYSNLNFAHNEKLYSSNKSSVIGNGSASGVSLTKFDISKKEELNQIARDELNIPSNAFVFGFVGRINKDKGINELLYSYKKILEKYKDTYLLLVGPNEITEGVNQDLYNWSREFKNVRYTGMTNVVEKYLSCMDCYILPSYREGFGMGVIEAEAMGVPVIVTNINGPIDAMKENVTGLICEKANVESLLSKMEYMLLNKEERIQFGLNGIELVRNNFEQKLLFKLIKEDRERLLNRGQ